MIEPITDKDDADDIRMWERGRCMIENGRVMRFELFDGGPFGPPVFAFQVTGSFLFRDDLGFSSS